MTGQELRAIRLKKGLSMAEIAKKAGVSVLATTDQYYKLDELDNYKFIVLRTEHIAITSQNGSFIKLEILKDDIGKAVFANHVTVKLGADDD